MSAFYDLASLVVVPSGYKSGKIYAQKPLTTDGQLAFSRASTATRVGPDGLIEKVRTNVLTYSQDLSNAAWQVISNGGPVTKTANAGTAPDGTNTASRVQITGGGTYTVVAQSGVNPLGIVTISGYFKRYGATDQAFRLFANNGSATANLTATDTWQRFSFTVNASSTGADGFANDTSNNPCDILVWGMQLETGDIATDYIATTTAAVSVGPVANVPRLDYLGATCGPRLLLEPQRTNLITFSEQFNNASWTKVETSITANTTVSPDGVTNADTLTADGTANEHQLRSTGVFTLTSGTTYTTSIFAKAGTNNFIQFVGSGSPYPSTTYANFDLGTGTLGDKGSNVTSSIVNYGNGWYRCSMTAEATATTSTNTFLLNIVTSKTSERGEANSLSTSVYLWGAQVEAGAYASSYIPTLGAAVTRGADAAVKTSASALIGQTEGTLYAEFDVTLGVNGGEYFLSDGTNVIAIQFPTSVTNTIRAIIYNGGSFPVTMDYTYSTAGVLKVAYAYKANDFVMYVNGVQRGFDTFGSVPACSIVQFGGAQNVASALVFKTRLSNSSLAELTSL